MSEGDLLVGIDAGHTVTKAVLIDVEGRELSVGHGTVPRMVTDPTWQELDMDLVWRGVADAVRDAVSGYETSRIRGVGACGHGEGLYLFDQTGHPTRPCVLATDSRAAGEATLLNTEAGTEFLELLGQDFYPASPAPLLLWMREHDRPALEAAACAVGSKDWLRFQLTGIPGTDVSDASAMFAGMRTHEWSARARELSHCQWAERLQTPISSSDAVVGAVTADAAERTGLATDTPVVAGAHDVHAAALGVGAIGIGDISMIMGTWSINQVMADQPHPDRRWHTRASMQEQRWLHMSSSPSSASNVNWAATTLGWQVSELHRLVPAAVVRLQSGPALPVFLPYLYGAPANGTPGGQFVNLKGWHTREDLLAAVVQGVAFNHRHHLDLLAERVPMQGPVRVTGGASRNDSWCQLMADVCQRDLVRSDSHESGARGAALLAGIGTGVYSSFDEAVDRATRTTAAFSPDAQRAARLDAAYRTYRDLALSVNGV